MNDYQNNIHNDRYTRGIIRRKIKQLIGRAGFTKQDHEDLEQDLLLRVLQAMRQFDPDTSHLNVFITTVVERTVATILRDKQAEKRDHRRISSLNVMIDVADEGPTELAQTISQREYDARRDRYPRSDEELAQLVQDMAEIISKLPGNLQDLAEQLKTKNLSEIAREMGIPRTTLNESIRKLRRQFEDAGLKEYM